MKSTMPVLYQNTLVERKRRYYDRVNGAAHFGLRWIPLVLSISTSAALAQSDSFQIHNGRSGRMHVGMTVEEFYQAFDRREIKLVDLDGEGMFSPALVVRSNGQVLVTGEIDKRNGDWIIFRIEINDRRYHTVAGLSVGSTLADLKRAYPGLKIVMGEGQQFAYAETESLSFGLDADIGKKPPDRSRVTSILMLH